MNLIETARLILRPFAPGDLDSLHEILSDPVTMSFWPMPLTREQSEQWLARGMANFEKNGMGRLAVILRESQTFIGTAGIVQLERDGDLENDLGYIIHHRYWRQGYATEAARALIAFGFDTLRLPRICANMPTDHIASRRVAERVGMRLEKEFRNPRNRDIPTCFYSRAVTP